jgi:hypothetical protein
MSAAVEAASNRNEYQQSVWIQRAAGAKGMTTSPSSASLYVSRSYDLPPLLQGELTFSYLAGFWVKCNLGVVDFEGSIMFAVI